MSITSLLWKQSFTRLAYRYYTSFLIRSKRSFSISHKFNNKEFANVTFVLPDNRELSVKAEVGQTFLDVVIDNDVDIDGYGACEGTLSCSTCHIVFGPEDFSRIEKEQRKISDDEEDMLDLAKDRTDHSRLGCQVKVAQWMNGIKITVPSSSDVRLG